MTQLKLMVVEALELELVTVKTVLALMVASTRAPPSPPLPLVVQVSCQTPQIGIQAPTKFKNVFGKL